MEYKNLPDMKALATLRAVVELGGVEEAGRALNVGQPAVTKRLRALDDTYGTTLMQRKGRKLSLTKTGERVYTYARLVLDHQNLLLDDLKLMQEGQDRLRLEVTVAIGEHLLPDLLLHFNEAYPQFRIQSRMRYSRRIQTNLATGMADIALMEIAPDHPDILVQKWLDDELVLVCGPGHPLWQKEMIAVEQITQLNYVLREPQSSMRINLDEALRKIAITEVPVAMEVGSTDTIIEMLGRGKHVSFLPWFAVREEIERERLFHIKVKGFRIMRTLWIARHRSNLDHPVAEALIALLRKEKEKR